MLAKLALRNMRRQIGNYLIYFISVALTVAMLFSVSSMYYSKQMQDVAANQDVKFMLIFVLVLTAVVTAFVLGYATSFMLKLRAKEFGLYLTMGMTRRNILTLYALETVFLSIFALAVGIILGLFLYQGAMVLLCNLMEITISFSSYSIQGLVFTIIISFAMFLLSNLTGAMYLRKVDIIHLLHGEKKEKRVKHPRVCGMLAFLSLCAIVLFAIKAYNSLINAMAGYSASIGLFLEYLIIIFILIFIFHYNLAKGITGLMLHNKRLCSKGTNTFILRQLSGKMTVSSIMIGLLAVLITFAVGSANVALSEKNTSQERLNQETPFDIIYSDSWNPSKNAIPLNQAEEIISSYNTIESKFQYSLYTRNLNELGLNIPQCQDEEYQDQYLPLSVFNSLLAEVGKPAITLNNEYIIIDVYNFLNPSEFDGITLNAAETTYSCGGVCKGYPNFCCTSFYAVVPDELIEGMTINSTYIKYNLVNEKNYDAFGLDQALLYTTENGYQNNQFSIRESNRMYNNAMAGVIAVGMMFVAIVFVCMALAILSIKAMSGMEEDRRNYVILYQLGVDSDNQKKTLFRQTFSYFALPFVLPILSSIPFGYLCYKMTMVQGFTKLLNQSVVTTIMTTSILILIYVLYFIVTYRSIAANIVQVNRNRR